MWRGGPRNAEPERSERARADEVVLVQRAIVDRRAFAPLYEQYVIPVYRYCFQRLHNPDEAWDATGATFHHALAALDGFRGGSFEGWLYRIARNACTDVLRASRPIQSLDADHEYPAPTPDPEAQALATLDRERLEAALRQLSPRRERIVRLHLEGLRGKEIATLVGVSHDMVRQEQRRALLHLADLLGVKRPETEGRDG
jgi:RNA polymerase sigma-70 factor (ECF subfamily)